jgi:predicted amidophosphoribosyltransferase
MTTGSANAISTRLFPFRCIPRGTASGSNQAALLAEWLSAHISVPCAPALQRIHYTTTQTAFDRAERIRNLHGAFRLRKNANVQHSRVFLIDDVLTTGSTLSECERVLKEGTQSVYAATAARD